MSAYQEFENIQFTDCAALAEALASLEEGEGSQWTTEDILVEKGGQPLFGYRRDNRNTQYKKGDANYAPLAEICIPGSGHPSGRHAVRGASNDIGFYRDDSGKLIPIISEYDATTYNECWMNRLKAKYFEVVATKRGKKLGYKVQKKKVNGKIKMTMTRWR